ncbi:hypothetical protein TNCT_336161 [Trichonephila clavata]|uniref:Endonuclease/exonuclease/phosphatase domain-containing protein n=1 Tax=Trichonephila clavata TaxID=2740835 RepID=A0A8X6LC61_TRICU|nr:hypothetical protein TNCT_336161 [Trichonephila clavata]
MGYNCFGLRITSWNANGVRSRIVELRDFVDKHNPDLILLQETHLGPGDTLQIPNYTTYRDDRPTLPTQKRRGGTASDQVFSPTPPHTHTADGDGGGDLGHPHPIRKQPYHHHFNLLNDTQLRCQHTY